MGLRLTYTPKVNLLPCRVTRSLLVAGISQVIRTLLKMLRVVVPSPLLCLPSGTLMCVFPLPVVTMSGVAMKLIKRSLCSDVRISISRFDSFVSDTAVLCLRQGRTP